MCNDLAKRLIHIYLKAYRDTSKKFCFINLAWLFTAICITIRAIAHKLPISSSIIHIDDSRYSAAIIVNLSDIVVTTY